MIPCRSHFLIMLLAGAMPATAENWPRLLGPRQDSSVSETGLNLDWPEAGPPRLWEAAVGIAYSPLVVARGKVYVYQRVGNEDVLEARDVEGGKVVWKGAYPSQYVDQYGYNNGPRGSPCVAGDKVITFGAEGVATCWNADTGARIWQRDLQKELNLEPNFFGTGVSPVVEGRVVIVSVGGTRVGAVLGLDLDTGKTLWSATQDGQSYSTPVVADLAGLRTAVVVTRQNIVALDPTNGHIRWFTPFVSRTYESVNAASPVISGDDVFCSATYGVGAVLLRAKPQGDWETVWRDRTAMENHWATSVKVGDHLYGMHGRHEAGSNLRCIEWSTGTVRWDAPKGLGRATLVRVQDHLLAFGERGMLAVIEATPEAYREKRRVQLLEHPCWAPPVISDGRLFLRNETRVLVLDLRKPSP